MQLKFEGAMSARRRQGVFFILLSLALSIFLIGHSLLVEVDFEACFGNLAASINGSRPYHRVGEMSFGELFYAASRAISVDQLIIAIFGFLPLSPFLICWNYSKSEHRRAFWTISALAAFAAIIALVSTRGLMDFYECDRNGVSLAILIAPIMYMAISLVAVLSLAFLRLLALNIIGRG